MRIFDNPRQLPESIINARLRQTDPNAQASTFAAPENRAYYAAVDSTMTDAQIIAELTPPLTTEETSEYTSTITQLQNIEAATNPTNAQVIAAVKYLARTIRIMLRLFVKYYR